ncbi:MAG: RtcB family protein [Muribaculaceae bacterium]|nr:RtcB family protein [Muribaculaceae bacterium]
MEIQGSETKAKVFTKNLNEATTEQIRKICSHPVFKDIPVRIMPDTHAGKNTVVGFTAPIGAEGKVIPSLIGGDIGCGMLCVKIDTKGKEIDFDKLDKIIRHNVSRKRQERPIIESPAARELAAQVTSLYEKFGGSAEKALQTLGTLGSGNHFIELDKDADGNTYLVVHTGSRRFGQEVFDYHQKIAEGQNPYEIEKLSYLSDEKAQKYLEDMQIAVKFSQINRRTIADKIIEGMGWDEVSSFESIHNYISEDGIIRKGAISAEKGKKVIIPLNMRDGAIIAEGKGNEDWNKSAPHGAGRQLSRGQASELIQLEEFQKSMEGIHSSCVSKATLDEAPQAYKKASEIISNIFDSVKIEKIIKPIFNFKNK